MVSSFGVMGYEAWHSQVLVCVMLVNRRVDNVTIKTKKVNWCYQREKANILGESSGDLAEKVTEAIGVTMEHSIVL